MALKLKAAPIRSYADAKSELGKRYHRKLCHNTELHLWDNQSIDVRYHGNPIVTYRANGCTTIRTEFVGRDYARNPTTRERINLYSPLSMWQTGRLVYYSLRNVDCSVLWNGCGHVFQLNGQPPIHVIDSPGRCAYVRWPELPDSHECYDPTVCAIVRAGIAGESCFPLWDRLRELYGEF